MYRRIGEPIIKYAIRPSRKHPAQNLCPVSLPQSVNASIGVKITQKRMRHRISQGQLASAIGISQNMLSRIEHGKSAISARALYRTARYFNVQMEWFFGEEE
jgi:DNA-binding XRE family transcriptional regulator